MIVVSKLDALRKNPEHLKRYNTAVLELKDLGIDNILLELALGDDIQLGHPEAATIALQQLGIAVGYKQCLHDLFSLDKVTFGESKRPIPDFGANKKLGISNAEAQQLAEV